MFRTKVKERDKIVISNAAVELFDTIPKPKAKKTEAKATPAAAASTPIEPRDVFAVMHDYLVGNPEVSKKVGVVYGFKLKNPDASFVVDAKGGTGAREGDASVATCTLELASEDFLALTRGEANPQKLFGSGKLKIGGDMMASMKLDFLTKLPVADFQKKADARVGAQAPVVAPVAEAPKQPSAKADSTPERSGPANAPDLRAALAKSLASVRGNASGALVLRVLEPDATLTIDFGAGTVTDGAAKDVATLVTVKDADIPSLRSGAQPLSRLFQRGVVRVDGDVAPAKHIEVFSRL